MGSDVSRNQKEEQEELTKMANRIRNQQEVLRKDQGEEQYKHLTKQDRITVYTNDKQR